MPIDRLRLTLRIGKDRRIKLRQFAACRHQRNGRALYAGTKRKNAHPMMRILSLGAGVQGTTIALMSARGELPQLDAAIFADTQSEPQAVYRHLDWLETQLPFPVYRLTAGSLREHILNSMAGRNQMSGRPPFFVGLDGMLRRQCTSD